MIVRKGVEPGNVSADDFEMMSAASDKIVLPFVGKLWCEMRLEAQEILFSALDAFSLERCTPPHYDNLIQKIDTKFLFSIQRTGVRITAYIDVESKDGTTAAGRVFLLSGLNEVRPVLDRFFSSGCLGLDTDYAKYYKKAYRELLEK